MPYLEPEVRAASRRPALNRRELLALGVDGIMTDCPSVLTEVLASSGASA